MPIKPIDMQVLLPQVQKANKAEINRQGRNEMAVQDQHTELKKENDVKRNQVTNMEKKDDHKLKNDLDKKSSQKKQNKKKQSKNHDKEEKEKKPRVKHGFDMKV